MAGSHGSEKAGTHRFPTLFGREREIGLLRAALADACDGHGSLVLISGEAGIGKTSLVRALNEDASSRGVSVHTGACYDLSVTPPYRPWLEIFASMGENIRLPSLPSSPAELPLEWASSQDGLFSEVIDVLRQASELQPRVLVLEDLHWTDSSSLEFLRFAARQVGGMSVLILVTYRETEINREHPLYLHLPALVRESDATRVSLRALDEMNIDAMLQERYELPNEDRRRLISYLQQRTEGNPFFIEELLRSLEENDVIRYQTGHWEMTDLRQVPVPSLVQQIIDNRLAQIDPAYRRILAVAAAVGQEIPLEIWQHVGNADDQTLAGAIREATRLHLMAESSSSGTLEFTHALIREALYHEVSLPERRSLHRAIAEASQESATPDPDTVAYHLQQAQDPRAPEWLIIAGERAQQLYAWRTAAERFAAALDMIGLNDALARERAWLSYRIGLLLMYADAETAIIRMQDAEHLARETGEDYLSACARADRGLLRCLTGDVRRGLDELRSGVEALDALEQPAVSNEPETNTRLSAGAIRQGAFRLFSSADSINARQGPLVFWLAWAGRYNDALAVGKPFVDRASQLESNVNDALGDGWAGLGHAFAALGHPVESLNAFARARDTYAAIDHHFKVGNTAIYELSEAFLPYRVDQIMEREWLADQAEAY